MSNYPPGVTGNEWQIAGVFSEYDEERECPACEEETLVSVALLTRNADRESCECLTCGYQWDAPYDDYEPYEE